MSMDRFWEEVAVKQKNGINRILYAFSWILIVFSGIIAVMSFSSLTSGFSMGAGIDWPTVLILLVSGGIAVYNLKIVVQLFLEIQGRNALSAY